MINRLILIFVAYFFTTGLVSFGQENWKLKSNKDDIAIYTRDVPNSRFKGIKVVCELNATLSQLVAVVMDVNTAVEWVYSTRSAVVLKQVSPSELYYYSEVNVPWPASNRDFIARLSVSQDAHTKVVTVLGPVFPDYIPEKKDIVRVRRSEGKWIISPVGKDRVRVEYTLNMDPGGNIPAWLVNMFATKGPYESFRKLKVQLKKPAFTHAHLSYIVD
ncbi:START domain-containing protein [Flavitalea sp. BT771]|uniref:START domain-containing protein n=1 Tax=Flavitalea sp. BT771 TaxID=3063329 RepID=UPI0026E3815A|nr:START domain-containing protein [Flavitalea sp. BT771]MDO6430827.1 START domain-containing protein [Flavitalea sp. BT771]MDV6219033.1 START domain-containing protein [Flavitalea sp. BT771]